MKKMRKGLIGVMCLLVIHVLSGCMMISAATPTLDITQVILSVGEKVELVVCDTDQAVKWSSSNKKVATVSQNGVVRAKRKGSVKITAKVGKKKLTCRVKGVKGQSGKNVSIILNAKKVTMNRGSSYVLKALVFPDGEGGKLIWKSSKKSVASVSKNGVIRARKPGKALISVYVGSKKNKASCTVVVKKKKGSKVSAILNPAFSQNEWTPGPGSTGGSSEGKTVGYHVTGVGNLSYSSGTNTSYGSSISQTGSGQSTGGGTSNPEQGDGGSGQSPALDSAPPAWKSIVSIDAACKNESVPSGYRFRIEDFVVTEHYSDGSSARAAAFSVSVETKNNMNTITVTDQGFQKTLYVPCIPETGGGTDPGNETEETVKVSASLNPATVNVGENLSDGQLQVTLIDTKTGQSLGQTGEYTTDFTPQMEAGDYPFHITCRGITLTVRVKVVDPAQSIQSISASYTGPHGKYLVMEEGVDPSCLNITAVMGDGSLRNLTGSEVSVSSVEPAAYDGGMTKVMEIALEVIDALHSTHPDGMREDFLDEAMHGAFTPGQTREYYKELMDELDRRKTDTI